MTREQAIRSAYDAWNRGDAAAASAVLEEADDRAVALVHVTARGRGSGVDVDLRPAHVWSFQGDMPTAVVVVPDREQALNSSAGHPAPRSEAEGGIPPP